LNLRHRKPLNLLASETIYQGKQRRGAQHFADAIATCLIQGAHTIEAPSITLVRAVGQMRHRHYFPLQQCLNFLPLPQWHGPLRPRLRPTLTTVLGLRSRRLMHDWQRLIFLGL
jgi:hypothetical protein